MEIGVPPGYTRNPTTGGIESIPWPESLEDLPPSLGFQVIEWAEENLVHHLTGEPWRYSVLQKKFIIMHYAVRENGGWVYRSSSLRMSKGSGKDPLLATLALAEMVGPTKFAGWDRVTGRPIGEAHRMSLVIMAANSEAQAQEGLLVANQMVSADLRAATGYESGKLGSSTPTGSRIKLMTASVKTAEGQPATAVFLNESHWALEANGGHRVADVARRNVAKSPGGIARIVEFTNAFEQGADSVAERTYAAWQAQVQGKTRRQDILYVSVEADPSLSFGTPEQDEQIIKQAYAYSPWIDQDRILAEVYDDRTSLADAIRFYANGVAATETAFVIPNSFDALAKPQVLDSSTEIAMFLDCSKSDDATALVGVRLSDGYTFKLGKWQAPKGAHDPQRKKYWSVPRESVDAAVREAFEDYRVAWFGVDPSPAKDDDSGAEYWMPLTEQWHIDFEEQLPVWASTKSAVLWDMRQSTPGGKERLRLFTEMCAEIRQAVDEDGTFSHDGSADLRTHFHNARTRSNIFGWSIGKETRDSPKKVDLAVAAVAAHVGRRLFLLSGKSLDSGRSGTAYFF